MASNRSCNRGHASESDNNLRPLVLPGLELLIIVLAAVLLVTDVSSTAAGIMVSDGVAPGVDASRRVANEVCAIQAFLLFDKLRGIHQHNIVC